MTSRIDAPHFVSQDSFQSTYSPPSCMSIHSEWWSDLSFGGSYPSDSLILTYELHPPTTANEGLFTSDETSYSMDLSLSPLSLFTSPSTSPTTPSTNYSISSSPVENLCGEPTPTDREHTAGQHSLVSTPFDSSLQPVYPSGLSITEPLERMPHVLTACSSSGRLSSRRLSHASRRKSMRPSPYPEVRSIPGGCRSSSLPIPTIPSANDDESFFNPLTSQPSRKTLLDSIDEECADSSAMSSIVREENISLNSLPGQSSPPQIKPSPKLISCTHPECCKTFTRQNDLHKHLSTAAVHNPKSPPECICHHCGASLSRNDALQRHQRNQACGKRRMSRKPASLPLP